MKVDILREAGIASLSIEEPAEYTYRIEEEHPAARQSAVMQPTLT